MDGVILTDLKKILNPKGEVFHAMKKSDIGFDGFSEAYFSSIKKDVKKGWKKHSKMTLNLIVPVGEIKFVIYNEIKKEFFSTNLSKNNYQRITIKPNLWVAFAGCQDENILLNIANLEHDPCEAINIEIGEIKYEW
jgi:dTDP-4-dehydrorhamnose 3,5-epimerase